MRYLLRRRGVAETDSRGDAGTLHESHEAAPTAHAMRNFDANTFNRTVLLCHMKHAKTEFMYLPILLTLEQAWQRATAQSPKAAALPSPWP